MMKPLSPHWADIAASRVIAEKGEKELYTVASGITPSGTVHIGNFREVITVDFVARALKALGKKVRFIYSWDDYDTFRKVPVNLPNQEMLKKELRRPISRVPDPWGKLESYAAANCAPFEKEITDVGIAPEFIHQHQRYSSGFYAVQIRHALEHRQDVVDILNTFRTEPLEKDWLPTSIYCEKCLKDEMVFERYDGEWNYSYECASCHHSATTDIRQCTTIKLNWRTDWPMRWAFENVDFEPGGKDHSSEGGSFDTASKIVKKLWNKDAPTYLQYDFVMIKGGAGKMSSSKGELFTLSNALSVYDPQMIRWIFAEHRPNHDFSLAFDEDVIKVYDEFDRAEKNIFENKTDTSPKMQMIRRSYELSLIDGKMPEHIPFRPPFRQLCDRLQICAGDMERAWSKFYQSETSTPLDKNYFMKRAQKAWNWLSSSAPDEFKYQIKNEKVDLKNIPENLHPSFVTLKEIIQSAEFNSLDVQGLQQLIYDRTIKAYQLEAKEFFKHIYHALIGRSQGPRLALFLKEIGQERLLKIF